MLSFMLVPIYIFFKMDKITLCPHLVDHFQDAE